MDNHVYVGSDRDPTDSWYAATPQCGLLHLPPEEVKKPG